MEARLVSILLALAVWGAHLCTIQGSFVKDFYELLLNDGDDDETQGHADVPQIQPGDIFVSGRIRIKADELGPPLTGADLAYYASKGLQNDGTDCHSPDSPRMPATKPSHIKKDVYQGDILTEPEHLKSLREEVEGGGGDFKSLPGYAEDSFGDFLKQWAKGRIFPMRMGNREKRSATSNSKMLWPGGKIPYTISANYTRDDRAVLSKTLEVFHTETCLQFVPRTTEADFIHITPVNSPNQDFCASVVGRQTGGQLVCLDKGCLSCLGHPFHELMHASGFWHEQSRPDRNEHISIQWDNIRPGEEHNFKMHSPSEINLLNSEYDIGSVMHYGPYFFAKDPMRKTIANKYPLPMGVHMGQRVGPSAIDVQKINRLYKCSIPCDNDYFKGTTECLIQKLNGTCFTPQMQQHCKRACGFCW